jgi:hypothetical protein
MILIHPNFQKLNETSTNYEKNILKTERKPLISAHHFKKWQKRKLFILDLKTQYGKSSWPRILRHPKYLSPKINTLFFTLNEIKYTEGNQRKGSLTHLLENSMKEMNFVEFSREFSPWFFSRENWENFLLRILERIFFYFSVI